MNDMKGIERSYQLSQYQEIAAQSLIRAAAYEKLAEQADGDILKRTLADYAIGYWRTSDYHFKIRLPEEQ